jgi:succinate dehydrogenase / fumarate reductase cytochrome b subunit
MQYILAAGFVIHIFYGTWLTWKNQKTRPVSYAVSSKTDVSWSSQNMWITGAMVLGFLVLHLYNYFYQIKFTDLIDSGQMNEYELVKNLFSISNWPFSVLYISWFILLALHLNHSLQSGFQTIGINNQKWIIRLKWVSSIYAIIIAVGFSSITIYFLIQSLINN